MSAEIIENSDLRIRRCTRCNTTHPLTIEYFNRMGGDFQLLCRLCDRAATKDSRRKRIERDGPLLKERTKRYRKTVKYCFSYYKTNSKLRFIDFALTFLEFCEFWQKPCSYCGAKIENIGLDRVNNLEGYVMHNVVSCCIKCNRAKHSMSLGEFRDFIRSLYSHLFEQPIMKG